MRSSRQLWPLVRLPSLRKQHIAYTDIRHAIILPRLQRLPSSRTWLVTVHEVLFLQRVGTRNKQSVTGNHSSRPYSQNLDPGAINHYQSMQRTSAASLTASIRFRMATLSLSLTFRVPTALHNTHITVPFHSTHNYNSSYPEAWCSGTGNSLGPCTQIGANPAVTTGKQFTTAAISAVPTTAQTPLNSPSIFQTRQSIGPPVQSPSSTNQHNHNYDKHTWVPSSKSMLTAEAGSLPKGSTENESPSSKCKTSRSRRAISGNRGCCSRLEMDCVTRKQRKCHFHITHNITR